MIILKFNALMYKLGQVHNSCLRLFLAFAPCLAKTQ